MFQKVNPYNDAPSSWHNEHHKFQLRSLIYKHLYQITCRTSKSDERVCFYVQRFYGFLFFLVCLNGCNISIIYVESLFNFVVTIISLIFFVNKTKDRHSKTSKLSTFHHLRKVRSVKSRTKVQFTLI